MVQKECNYFSSVNGIFLKVVQRSTVSNLQITIAPIQRPPLLGRAIHSIVAKTKHCASCSAWEFKLMALLNESSNSIYTYITLLNESSNSIHT